MPFFESPLSFNGCANSGPSYLCKRRSESVQKDKGMNHNQLRNRFIVAVLGLVISLALYIFNWRGIISWPGSAMYVAGYLGGMGIAFAMVHGLRMFSERN